MINQLQFLETRHLIQSPKIPRDICFWAFPILGWSYRSMAADSWNSHFQQFTKERCVDSVEISTMIRRMIYGPNMPMPWRITSWNSQHHGSGKPFEHLRDVKQKFWRLKRLRNSQSAELCSKINSLHFVENKSMYMDIWNNVLEMYVNARNPPMVHQTKNPASAMPSRHSAQIVQIDSFGGSMDKSYKMFDNFPFIQNVTKYANLKFEPP